MVRGAKWAAGLLVLAVGAGCTPKETTACNDTVSALLVVEKRCGNAADDDTIRASLESQLTAGTGCGSVIRIRDEDMLRMQCFPALTALSCADYITAGTPTGRTLPATCVNQIIRRPDYDAAVDDSEAGEAGEAGDAGEASDAADGATEADAPSADGGTLDAGSSDAGLDSAVPDATVTDAAAG